MKIKLSILIFSTLLLIGLSLFLRYFKLNSQLWFYYDQAHDAFAIQRILNGQLVFSGPMTGIPGFFVGPFIYYLLAFFYWLGSGDPLVPISFLIILDVFGILISCFMVKRNNNWLGFFICLLLLGTNYSHIKHSRWLSNPNPILVLAPLYFFLLAIFLENKNKLDLDKKISLLMGLILGLLIQTELANSIFFIPTTIFAIIIKRKKINFNLFIRSFGIFFLTLIPLIIFNLTHKFVMFTAFYNYFIHARSKIPLTQIFLDRPKQYYEILTLFFSPKENKLFLLCFLFVTAYLIIKKFWQSNLLTVLTCWFFTPLILMLFYSANNGIIWDYYLISQPIPFIMLFSLGLVDFLKNTKIIGKSVVILLLFLIIQSNIKQWYLDRQDYNNTVSFANMKKTIDYIYKEAQNKPFNVDIFVPNMMPVNYEYLFQWYGIKKYGYLPSIDDKRERLVFFIMEPGQKYKDGEQYWRNWWYNKRKNIGQIVNTYNAGEIDVEKRERLSL